MPRPRALLFALTFAGLAAGCGRGGDVDSAAGGAGQGVGVKGDSVEWRGSLPCADCQAIDTRLVLARNDGDQVYELVEVYVAADGSMRFEEAGEWRLDDALLTLEPRTGGLRRYRVAHGGMLQVRDPDGRVFPGREDDVLLPIGRHP